MLNTDTSTRTLPSDQDASGRSLGAPEIEAVTAAIRSGTLTSTKGRYVSMLQARFAEMIGARFAYACASGTAAIHCAIAAIDPDPGDEIITTSITDMGALAPILYQGAIPVFADVDPATCNVTAETIAARITTRTRAIVVTHLFGNPCDMVAIRALADRHGIPIIEDCAQAFLATVDGRFVGTIGEIGCFSLQQGKHVTTGEGGIVVTEDEKLARRINLFINKAWGYGDAHPDHTFLALNYRMSELCGSVGYAQLEKLWPAVDRRRDLAALLDAVLARTPELHIPAVLPGARHSYWKYAVRVADDLPADTVLELAALLRERGVTTVPRYIQKPAFRCEVFEKRRTFGKSGYPFTLASADALDYSEDRYPGTFAGLERILVIPWNDRYTEDDVLFIAGSIKWALSEVTAAQVHA